MAILGQLFTSFPVFFEIEYIHLIYMMEIFPDTVGNLHIYILHFCWVIGIKRRARLIPKKHTVFSVSPLPAGLKLLLWLLVRLTGRPWR
ncbi:MAG: hypothetical protein ACRCYL_07735 [Kluyvera sp.]